jgi:hypothetical protein
LFVIVENYAIIQGMGQDIGWYRLKGRNSTGGWNQEWAEDAPDKFSRRFPQRWDWYISIFGVPNESIITCGCCQNGYTYGCDTSSVVRPTDFKAFREKLSQQGLLEPDEDGDCVCRDMTDWLEQHPDVYVEYS